jgi:hypothetical protein
MDIKNDMKYTGPLLDIPATERNNEGISLIVGRKKMVEDLLKLGLIPNKSSYLKFPTFEQVPENLMSHFLRGLFEGDGSIKIQGKNGAKSYVACTISISLDFCRELNMFLQNKLHITASSITPVSEDKLVASIAWWTKSDAIKFLRYIYKDSDSSLRLDRKYQKALPFLSPETQPI